MKVNNAVVALVAIVITGIVMMVITAAVSEAVPPAPQPVEHNWQLFGHGLYVIKYEPSSGETWMLVRSRHIHPRYYWSQLQDKQQAAVATDAVAAELEHIDPPQPEPREE